MPEQQERMQRADAQYRIGNGGANDSAAVMLMD